jgi:hypothetical protein
MAKASAPTWDVIKTYFRQSDIDCMLQQTQGAINLGDCASVLKHAKDIYAQVSSGNMPPGGPSWSPEWVANFYAWWHSNPKCP